MINTLSQHTYHSVLLRTSRTVSHRYIGTVSHLTYDIVHVSLSTASHRTISNVSRINGTALQHSYLSLSQCAYCTASHLPYRIPRTVSHHTHRTFCIISHRIASNNTLLSETCHNFLYRVDIPYRLAPYMPYRIAPYSS